MMEEIWKDIQGFEGRYQVSNLGRVKRTATSYYRDYPYKKNVLVCYWPEKIQTIEHTGKVRLRTIKGEIDHLFDVGNLVAQSFIEEYKEGMAVRHKDGNIMNNHVDNLYICIPETIDKEEWKDVKGFEGRYQISNMGRVRSLDRWTLNECPHFVKGMMLKPSLNNGHGYLRVAFSDGRRNYKHYEVHRLVALHFVPGYKEGLVVNHKNEIKTDNRAENLEWCTYQYNLNYSDVVAWKRKPVYQYTMDGDFIAKHKCCADVEKMMGTYQGAMVHVMYESKTGAWKGYRWSFEPRTKEYWQAHSIKGSAKRRRVNQYDLNMNYIRTYNSVSEAADDNRVSVSCVSLCCRRKSTIAKKYLWRYAD